MNDRIRISDADRERATARLREHFAEGRLTSEELDERITDALAAKTYGDLRRVMADLPDPSPVPPTGNQGPPWAYRPRSEEHTSELQSRPQLVCRLLLEKKKHNTKSSKVEIPEKRGPAPIAANKRD